MATDSENPAPRKPATVPPRRKRTWNDYVRHYLPVIRNWRYYFTREKIVEQLRMLAVVVPLTLLIWVYAERWQIVDVPNVNVAVKIYSSDPQIFVENRSNNISLKLTGPQEAIERVREWFALHGGLSIDLGQTMARGRNQEVDIVNRIQNYPTFKDNGVTVGEAQPSQVPVDIDVVEHHELDVEIPPGITNLSKETHFDPPKVLVSGPGSLFNQGSLHVYAKVGLLNDPGVQQAKLVPVQSSPDDPRLQVTPSQVTATLVVQASDMNYSIDSVPILVQGSPDILNTYSIDVIRSIPAVAVSGPPDAIEQLKKKEFIPHAILDINPSDAGRDDLSRVLRYDLPPGVKVIPDSDATKPISFKLTLR